MAEERASLSSWIFSSFLKEGKKGGLRFRGGGKRRGGGGIKIFGSRPSPDYPARGGEGGRGVGLIPF